MAISYRQAQLEDVYLIVNLINFSYRGDGSKSGWTTEADLLEGVRTTPEEITSFIQNPQQNLLLLSFEEDQLIGCILAEKRNLKVRFGMFVTHPTLQGKGLGKQLLKYAEEQVKEQWHITDFEMIVISCRKELLEYYERRGYFFKGKTLPFPLRPHLWKLKVNHLDLKVIEKSL
jgi:GNAT superfamily N-acetyltransferase